MLPRAKEFLADIFFFVFLPVVILVPLVAGAYMLSHLEHTEVKGWFNLALEWIAQWV